MAKGKRKTMVVLATLLGLGAIAYGALCIGIRQWQTHFIFFPEDHLDATPSAIDLAYEEVWIDVGEGAQAGTVHGWWIPMTAETHAETAPVILYFHGNGSNLGDLIEMAQHFHQLGWHSFLIDYRGYGLSQGPFPNEQRVYEDAIAAWHYLVEDRQIDPQRIVAYGHSLGGAIAIDLATRQPTMAGVIAEGSFTSMYAMATRQGRYQFLPVDWLLTQRFNSLEKVRSLTIPVLFLHGEQDQTVPPAMSQALHKATSAPSSFVLIPEAGHNNVPTIGGEIYTTAIQSFVAHHIAVAN